MKMEKGLIPKTSKGQVRGISVICTHCNYKFLYKPKFNPICPYCGRSKLKSYENVEAQDLVDSSTEN